MIAVDTNVVAYLYLRSNYTKYAETLLQRDPEWVAPVLWRSEFRSVLAGFMRRKVLVYEQAREIQREAESLFAGHEYEVDSNRVLELVRDSNCSAYDCEFVALAMQLDVELFTMDAKLRRAFPTRAVSLLSL